MRAPTSVRFVGVDDLWPAGVVELTLGAAVTTACIWRDRRPILVLVAVAAAVAVHRLALSAIDAGFSIPS